MRRSPAMPRPSPSSPTSATSRSRLCATSSPSEPSVSRAPTRRAMPSLTVWRYDAPMGADAGAVRLKNLEQQGALKVHDAITVTWMPREKQPRIAQVHHTTSAAAGKGSLLGGLIGLVVLAP